MLYDSAALALLSIAASASTILLLWRYVSRLADGFNIPSVSIDLTPIRLMMRFWMGATLLPWTFCCLQFWSMTWRGMPASAMAKFFNYSGMISYCIQWAVVVPWRRFLSKWNCSKHVDLWASSAKAHRETGIAPSTKGGQIKRYRFHLSDNVVCGERTWNMIHRLTIHGQNAFSTVKNDHFVSSEECVAKATPADLLLKYGNGSMAPISFYRFYHHTPC